jgi:3-methyladenine DNA glycosylase AlkD
MGPEAIMERLKTLANPDAIAPMARFGINPKKAYGLTIPTLRKLAKEIGTDHLLAERLWSSGIREARILATMIENPGEVDTAQMDRWARQFDSWDVCDQCCNNLFSRTDHAYQKAAEWSTHDKEFVKRAGFVLMACLAIHDKKAQDDAFATFLTMIKQAATDDRNPVKKAVNWALRQIGKRNPNLYRKALRRAREIYRMDVPSARWVGRDALRELNSKAVQKRIGVT